MFDFIQETPADYGPVAAEEQSALHWLVTNRNQLRRCVLIAALTINSSSKTAQLHAELVAAKVPHTFEEFPGGHEWPYWEKHLADTLKFFNSSAPPAARSSSSSSRWASGKLGCN